MTASDAPAQRAPGLGLLLVAYFGFIVFGILGGMLGVLWLYLQPAFGLTLDSLGVFLFVGTVSGTTTLFFAGPMIPRLGIGLYLIIGGLVVTLALLGQALAPAWEVLLLGGLVAGFGLAMLNVGFNTFLATHYSASRLNWLHACFGLGSTIGPSYVTLVVEQLGLGWQWCLGLVAALTALLALVILLTLPHWPARTTRQAAAAVPAEARSASLRASLTRPAVLAGMALFFIYVGVETGTGQLAPALLEGRGLDPSTIGAWTSAFWGSLTAGRLLLGFIVDRVGSRTLLRLSVIGALLGVALLWWNPFEGASLAGLILNGFAVSTVSPTMASLTPQRVGRQHTSNAMGFQWASTSLGIAFWPWLGGLLAEYSGREALGLFLTLIGVLAVLWFEFMIWQDRRARRAGAGAVSPAPGK